MNEPVKQWWDLYWSPEGKRIKTVLATTEAEAIAQTPKPYSKYLGEIYAVQQGK